MDDFAGKAVLVDPEGLQRSLDVLDVGPADLWTVIGVETSGCGYLADRRPTILYERHVFSRLTEHRFDAQWPSVSNPTAGGYGAPGDAQYDRLSTAMALDPVAALQSCSWGIGQVMGYHSQALGYGAVREMVDLMKDSEAVQLEAVAKFIDQSGLAGALRRHDWARFAKGYNGPNYRANNYDKRLAATYRQMSSGGMPDLAVRSLQGYLLFLGYDPHGVDGVMGRMTRAAMNDFQAEQGLPVTEAVDDTTIAAIRDAVAMGRVAERLR